MKFNDDNSKDYTVMKSDNLKPCVECGDLTQYIDYCYECRICSKECEHKVTDYILNMV